MEQPDAEAERLHTLLQERPKSAHEHLRRGSPRPSWRRSPSADLSAAGLAPQLGLSAIVAMSFFNVSGGPFGSEDIFSKSDPLMGVCGILIFALCFSLPQMLITAELCCALPSNGGYAIWAREAFGDFWCFQMTYWKFVGGIADSAVYPVIVCDTVLQILGLGGMSTAGKVFCRSATVVLLSLPAYLPSSKIAGLMVTFGVVTAAPVLAFTGVGLRRFDPAVFYAPRSSGHAKFGKFINNLFWSLEGWDCISTCTLLCAEPREKTIIRGLSLALAIALLQYVFVLLAATAISPTDYPWEQWSDGTLPSIATVVGPSMGSSLLLASLAGNAGQYFSGFVEGSYLLQGAAEVKIVPSFLGKQLPKSGAPYMASTAQLLCIVWMMSFDFHAILLFDNFFTANGVAMELAAFTLLRWKRPDLQRPFKAPSALLPLFVPAAGIIVIIWWHCLSGDAMLVNVAAFALGIPYGLWVAGRSRREHTQGHAKSAFDVWVEDDG